jgi:hypothetical protein
MQSDHLSFFIYEIFTYLITFLIEDKKFEQVSEFLNDYYSSEKYSSGLVSFTTFIRGYTIFNTRNKRLQMNRRSLLADVVKERCNYKRVTFEKLMQTDLLLYICYLGRNKDKSWWYPRLLVFAGHDDRSFEIFARATSKKFFNNSMAKLGFTVDSFKNLATTLGDHGHFSALWPANMRALSNVDHIATQD